MTVNKLKTTYQSRFDHVLQFSDQLTHNYGRAFNDYAHHYVFPQIMGLNYFDLCLLTRNYINILSTNANYTAMLADDVSWQAFLSDTLKHMPKLEAVSWHDHELSSIYPHHQKIHDVFGYNSGVSFLIRASWNMQLVFRFMSKDRYALDTLANNPGKVQEIGQNAYIEFFPQLFEYVIYASSANLSESSVKKAGQNRQMHHFSINKLKRKAHNKSRQFFGLKPYHAI